MLERMKKGLTPGPAMLVSAWDRLHGVPGGKKIFSRMIDMMVPYTGSIGCEVKELRSGFAAVELTERRAVRNHLNSIHAIALANLAELCGNLALSFSMPSDARFIVGGLSVDYTKKARGVVTATSECPVPTSNERAEYEVPVVIRDASGDIVANVTLRTLVGPNKSAKADG